MKGLAILILMAAVLGSPTLAQSCSSPTSSSLSFDDIDDWVNIPDHPALDGFADFTIEFWILHTTDVPANVMHKWTGNSGTIVDDCYAFEINTVSGPTRRRASS